jgi:hypothetical protein
MAQETEKTGPPSQSAETQDLDFHFIKSNFFRVIYVTGAHGGVGPDGNIHLAVFNERQPIPTKQTVRIVDGQQSEQVGRPEQRTGLVREVEANLVFPPATARAVYDVLKQLLEKREEIGRMVRDQTKKESQ